MRHINLILNDRINECHRLVQLADCKGYRRAAQLLRRVGKWHLYNMTGGKQ